MHNQMNDPAALLKQVAQELRLPEGADLYRELLPALKLALSLDLAQRVSIYGALLNYAQYQERRS